MSNTDKTNRVAITDIEAPESVVNDAEAQSVTGGVMLDPTTGKSCTDPRGGRWGTLLPPIHIPGFDPSKIFGNLNGFLGRANLP